MKWLRGRSYTSAAKELRRSLHGDNLDLIREDVFFLYRGNQHDPLLFALSDALNNKVSIAGYHLIYKLVIKLCKRLEKEERERKC